LQELWARRLPVSSLARRASDGESRNAKDAEKKTGRTQR
jgi:hypothetical protein